MCYNNCIKNKMYIVKKAFSYNSLSFAIFVILLASSFSYFSAADDTNLTLFDDFDRDGVSNGEESSYGTNPTNADTDDDGYSDGVEIQSGYNPLIPAPGDRIITAETPSKIIAHHSQTNNVTQQIAEKVVSHLADAQENGDTEISSEEFSKVVSDAIDPEMLFDDVSPVDLSEITIKKQDYAHLSDREENEMMKQDVIEYVTAISYIFVSSFPDGFFDRSPDLFQAEIMQNMNNFSGTLTSYSYFESMAEDAIAAESQMKDVEVPEEMLEIHTEGLYILRYIGSLYENGQYKNVSSDVAPMIATLAQMQGLIEKSLSFQEKVQEKMVEYEIDGTFLEI